jgi:hypothetical protein
MTLQDLKDNREEVIEIINENAEKGSMKLIMEFLIKNINEKANVFYLEDIVLEAIEDLGKTKKAEAVELTLDGEKFYNINDYNAAASKKLMRNI